MTNYSSQLTYHPACLLNVGGIQNTLCRIPHRGEGGRILDSLHTWHLSDWRWFRMLQPCLLYSPLGHVILYNKCSWSLLLPLTDPCVPTIWKNSKSSSDLLAGRPLSSLSSAYHFVSYCACRSYCSFAGLAPVNKYTCSCCRYAQRNFSLSSGLILMLRVGDMSSDSTPITQTQTVNNYQMHACPVTHLIGNWISNASAQSCATFLCARLKVQSNLSFHFLAISLWSEIMNPTHRSLKK